MVGLLELGDTLKTFAEEVQNEMLALHMCALRASLRPVVLWIIMCVALLGTRRLTKRILLIPIFINAVLAGLSIRFCLLFAYRHEDGAMLHYNTRLGLYSFVLSGTYLLLLLVFSLLERKNKEQKSMVMIGYILVSSVIAIVLESLGKNNYLLDSAVAIEITLYYLFQKGETYRVDALTKLLNRHNLDLHAADLEKDDYDLVFIDIDNFKLINDKYGHMEGDRAICEVVNTAKSNLLAGCRMYRFGGDEFVILSKNNTREKLEDMLKQINEALSEKDYSISCGIMHHNPEESFAEVCDKADMLMYEQKRKAKSEDIWDQMTGLFNLRGFLDELEIQKKHVLAAGQDTALVCVDIDRLGHVNDVYGHKEGDELIRKVAKMLDDCLEKGEFIGHIGTDEFIIALTIKGKDDPYTEAFIERIQEKEKLFNALGEKEYTLQLNHSIYVVGMKNWTDVNTAVEEAFYTKRIDKNNRRRQEGMVSETKTFSYNAEDERKVVETINNNALSYVFQPIVTADGGEIIGYEGLMRCQDDSSIGPESILQYAMKNKLLYEIEKLSFNNILEIASQNKAHLGERNIFINSIPGQLMDDSDFEFLRKRYGEILKRTVVEITEQSELDEGAIDSLQNRSESTGFQLAIDDYGSGYSNTTSLLKYMPQIVKIDRFLIHGIESDSRKQHFVNSVVNYAHANGIKVLAEGVENEKELRSVIYIGVDLLQGFYLARPQSDFMEEIPSEIRDEIIKICLQRHEQSERKVFVAQKNTELPLMKLAMEMYTGIVLGSGYAKIVGNAGYTADMSIRIKDDSELRLVLSEVELKDAYKLPCLDLGERVKLTLVIEGNNSFDGGGIRVPESSELEIKGNGSLRIAAKGHDCYGIGNEPGLPFGKIQFAHSGLVEVSVDGNRCCAVGGGYGERSSIQATSGKLDVNVAAESGVGIGTFEGPLEIALDSMDISAECRVREGSVVGCLRGNVNVAISGTEFKAHIAGNEVVVLGAAGDAKGTIKVENAHVDIGGNGQSVIGMGAASGDVLVDLKHTGIEILLEGNNVCGLGTLTRSAKVHAYESLVEMRLHAAERMLLGAEDENVYANSGREKAYRLLD
ncbi:MAG: EAL domain-containing protein [Lachnospiraceae bacterium]|nr:EAL domain-containing protein [Lachnospiraceae bacterium]